MDEKILINEYRSLYDGEKSQWRQMTSIGEFIWDGAYAIRLVKDDASLGLPFKFSDEEVVNLVVKDQTRDANTQNDRVIVQTLTRVDRSTGNVFTYTRARCYNNGEHKWGEWRCLEDATTAMLQDDSVTIPKLALEVREKIENPLRPLFIAAGALYNETDEVIKRTAFWGEEVDHLPKHYYLNGLGDITEEEMNRIYNLKEAITQLIASGTTCGGRMFQDTSLPRTLFGTSNTGRWTTDKTIAGNVPFSSNNDLEVVKWTNTNGFTPVYSASEIIKCDSNSFLLCSKLRIIDRCQTTKVTDWGRVPNIEELRLHSLQYNVTLSSNPKISKASILYMIENVLTTLKTAIVITLKTSVYAKCIEGGEWYSEIKTALDVVNGYTDTEGNEIAGTITGGGSINLVSA